MSRLYLPARPIAVRLNSAGAPLQVSWRGAVYTGICLNHWRIHTAWWEGEERRDYYLFYHPHLVCELYRDEPSKRWYMHRIYD